MNRKSMTLGLVTLLILFTNGVYGLNQNFEGGGTPYAVSFEGAFNIESNSGNNYMYFGHQSGQMGMFSSIAFEGVSFSLDNPILSFDYKFEYSFDAGKFSDFANDLFTSKGINLGAVNLDFGAADAFQVAILDMDMGVDEYILFKQQLFPGLDGAPDTVVISDPSSLNLNPTITPLSGGGLDGFYHVELDLTELINLLSFEEYILYFDVMSNGISYSYNGHSGMIPDDIFTYRASVDNINLSNPVAAVPEPAAYALFIFGMWYLGKRIKRQ